MNPEAPCPSLSFNFPSPEMDTLLASRWGSALDTRSKASPFCQISDTWGDLAEAILEAAANVLHIPDS